MEVKNLNTNSLKQTNNITNLKSPGLDLISEAAECRTQILSSGHVASVFPFSDHQHCPKLHAFLVSSMRRREKSFTHVNQGGGEHKALPLLRTHTIFEPIAGVKEMQSADFLKPL